MTNARLYLATAYAAQFIPGVPSDENREIGKQAVEEFQQVLKGDPANLSAIDRIGSLLYNMGGTSPYNQKLLLESKEYHLEHTRLKPDDPEPYYWIGIIDWSIAYRTERQMREDWKQRTAEELPETEFLPESLRQQLEKRTKDLVAEGMTNLKKAIELRPDYDDAIAYLNLMYRRKAEIDADPNKRDEDTETADELVHKIQLIKEARVKQQSPDQNPH